MRLRSSHTSSENDHVGSHIVLDPNGGTPETKLYHLAEPVQGHMAVSRDYLDQNIAEALGSLGGGVPVGSAIWINSDAPDGWFKHMERALTSIPPLYTPFYKDQQY